MRRHDFELPEPPANDRPGDAWVCGHADEGAACAHGPSASGKCPAVGTCRPVAAARGGWRCTRPTCLGGACDAGPTFDGGCGLHPVPCAPRPSWRSQRRRITVGCLAASAVVLLMMIVVPWTPEPLRPGPLSGPHAQILGSRLSLDRCAACHPAAQGSLASWFTTAGASHAGVTQSQLCIECHHATIAPQRAMMAHQLTAAQRTGLRADRSAAIDTWHDLLPAAAVAMDNVRCATCHREHQGSGADLAALTNHQCQTCHSDRFAGLADGHPDWGRWPYGRGGGIAFDHASHFGKHFADSSPSADLDCRSCHASTETGEFARSGSFESTCAACHDASLRIEAAVGIDLLALPSLPPKQAGGLAPWPLAAQGFYSGRIGPLTRLLISGDPAIADALKALPIDGDWDRIDPANPTQRAAAAEVAVAIRQLMDDVAQRGSASIAQRAADRGLSEATAGRLAESLSPQMVLDARQRWFGTAPPRRMDTTAADRLLRGGIRLVADFGAVAANPLRQSVAAAEAPPADPARIAQNNDDQLLLLPTARDSLLVDPLSADRLSADPLLGEPLLADPLLTDPLLGEPLLVDPLLTDPLLGDPLTPFPEPDHQPAAEDGAPGRSDFDPGLLSPAGGWYQDEMRLAISYRGGGHADPVLQAAVELAGQLPAGDALAGQLRAHRSVAACIQCHPGARANDPASWSATRADAGTRPFTRFSHRPHNHLPLLADCVHCHVVTPPAAGTAAVLRGNEHQFQPLRRQTCAACHTAAAAGESCTQCHRYHVDLGDLP